MNLKIKKGVIYACEEGLEDRAIGAIFDVASDEDERIIECGSEAIKAVEDFVEQVNSGSFKPRQAVKRFEEILMKYAV